MSSSEIDQIPIEVLIYIFKLLTAQDLTICAEVSLKWKEIITSIIFQPILRNLTQCSHELRDKFLSMGWSDQQSGNDPGLIISLFEDHKRKYLLFDFPPEQRSKLSKIIEGFGFMVHGDDYSYESDITHVIVPKSMMSRDKEWDKRIPNCWVIWASFLTGKTFVSENHLHKCKEENRILLEQPFVPKSIRQLQSAMNHTRFSLTDPLVIGSHMNVSEVDIQKVQDEMGIWREERSVEKVERQIFDVLLRELRREFYKCHWEGRRKGIGMPMGTSFCSSCKDIPK